MTHQKGEFCSKVITKDHPPISSLIAFDEKVTFWLQRILLLPCACAYVALFAREARI